MKPVKTLLPFVVALAAAALAAQAPAPQARAASASCAWGWLSQPFRPWNDAGWYFLPLGGDFEGTAGGWTTVGGAAVVPGNESYYVGTTSDSASLALPTTSSSVTSPTMCVTSQTPVFRLFIRNNGNNGYTDGQLAFYVNFTGADGKAQTVKIAGLKGKTSWTLTAPISFIQYISTPLNSGIAQVSFTIKPNDNHGNWQIDDFNVDPYLSK